MHLFKKNEQDRLKKVGRVIIKRPTLFHLSSLHDDSPGNPTASTTGVGKKTADLRIASAAPTQVTALGVGENGSLSTEISLPPHLPHP